VEKRNIGKRYALVFGEPRRTAFAMDHEARRKGGTMRRLTVVLLATAALSMPALAQVMNAPPGDQQYQQQQSQARDQQPAQQPQANGDQGQNNQGQNNQAQTNQDQNANQQVQNQPMQPQDLSRNEVKQLQSALNNNGANVGRVDGRWGPKTQDALSKFQQSKGIAADGQIDQQTVADLGLNANQFEQQGNSTSNGS
jgi:murein L,D-transpeptidase YcbB/YkuD